MGRSGDKATGWVRRALMCHTMNGDELIMKLERVENLVCAHAVLGEAMLELVCQRLNTQMSNVRCARHKALMTGIRASVCIG